MYLYVLYMYVYLYAPYRELAALTEIANSLLLLLRLVFAPRLNFLPFLSIAVFASVRFGPRVHDQPLGICGSAEVDR